MKAYKPCILTPRQFLFMQTHHDQIMRENFYEHLGGGTRWLRAFSESDAFIYYFGDMCLDDVLDRYEDTPGYSDKLRMELFAQLRADAENDPYLAWYLNW